ncbi:MAG: Ig-like domain-containing protein [Thermoplasmatota archaeon]
MDENKVVAMLLLISLILTSVNILPTFIHDGEDIGRPDGTINHESISVMSVKPDPIDLNSAPDQPSSHYPENNSKGIPLNVTLSVQVSDPEDDLMNVSFYDSTDTLIDVDYNVSSGSNASIEWTELAINTSYTWYTNVSDGTDYTVSSNWTFQTGSVDYVAITDTPGGRNLTGGDVPMNYVEYGYSSAYNKSAGYLTTVSASWSSDGGNLTEGELIPREYNGIDVGNNASVKVWFNASYNVNNLFYNDSVLYNVSSITIDHINITDTPNGTALLDRSLPVEKEIRGYLSAYNNTEGYLFTIKGNWTAEGGNAYLLEKKINESNVIDVGNVPGKVWFNLSYAEYNYSITYSVIPPTTDYVDMTYEPNGSAISDAGVPVGHKIWGNCSAYNDTVGYIGTKGANWSVHSDPEMDTTIGPTPANRSWIDVGTVAGTVLWNVSIYEGGKWSNDTVNLKVNAPTLDYILITDGPGGPVLQDKNVSVGRNISGYSSAYNETSGFMYTVDANWTAEGASSNLSGPSVGNTSSIDVGTEAGKVWFNASYGGLNDSVMFNVTEPTVDHIKIVDQQSSGQFEITDRDVYVDKEIIGYAASFNNTAGYIGDVVVDWSVVNLGDVNASTVPASGDNSTFYCGMEEGEAEWLAEYSTGIVDNVSFDILAPEIDYIQIRSESGGEGEVLDALTYKVNDTDDFYCGGYNRTYGYIRDVEAEWASENPDVGSVGPDAGVRTTFKAESVGNGTIYAVYRGMKNSTYFRALGRQSPDIDGKIPDITLEEDFGVHQIDLEELASDPQDDKSGMRWYITGVDGSVISTAGENQTGNHIISLISHRDEYGDMKVRYWLVDSDGNKDSQAGWINITPVNDAPRIDPIPDIFVHFDDEYSFDYSPYISDVDDPMDGLTLATDDTDHTTINGLKVIYDYPESMVGEEVFVRLTVSDGDKTTSRVIKVKITANYPPENVLTLPDVSLDEGETLTNVFDLDDYIMDPDEDSLYMSYGYTHLNITIHEDHTVDMHAYSEWNGRERVTFRAQDPTGAIVEQTINVTVNPVNDPPSLRKLPPFVLHHSHPYTFDLAWYISDPDNSLDELTITTSDDEHVTVEGTDLIMEYPEVMGGLSAPYTVSLSVTVSDGVDSTFQVTSVKVGYNYPPELVVPLHDIAFYEDEKMINAFDLDKHFRDVDSETIFYTSGNENITVKINDNHTVDFSATPDWNGKEVITIRGTDPDGALMEDTITVTVIPVNDPPEIRDIPLQKGEVGKSWILDLDDYIYDIDDEKQDLVVTTDDTQVEVAQHKLIFTFDDPGLYTIGINVSDGEYTSSGTISVEVNETEEDEAGLGILELIIILLIPIVSIGAFVMWKRKRKYTVEDVFLIHKSGVLIKHKTRTLKAERDEDILAGMFTAVQNFVDDAFKEEEEGGLKRMDYGEKKVLVHKGENVILAVFFSGTEPKWALESMTNFVSDIEKRYKGKIDKWKGDLEELPGINDMMDDFVEFKGKYKESEWEE